MDSKHVLSIQSHVVFGVVGNKAAVFPLQLRGFRVDPLNVCQLSNHTGYGRFTGSRCSASEFDDLWVGLDRIGALDRYGAVLLGYIGRAPVLERVIAAVTQLRRRREILILCDPVCGDDGALYVPEDVPPLYEQLLSLSDAATPNGFEAELLTGTRPRDAASAAVACEWFHQRGVKLVVISSFDGSSHEFISIFASLKIGQFQTNCVHETRRFHGKFSGTGDLFSALVLSDLQTVLETRALSDHLNKWCKTMAAVLSRTPIVDDSFSELDLVGCQDVLKEG
jgi:pyridoxine kinase